MWAGRETKRKVDRERETNTELEKTGQEKERESPQVDMKTAICMMH